MYKGVLQKRNKYILLIGTHTHTYIHIYLNDGVNARVISGSIRQRNINNESNIGTQCIEY